MRYLYTAILGILLGMGVMFLLFSSSIENVLTIIGIVTLILATLFTGLFIGYSSGMDDAHRRLSK